MFKTIQRKIGKEAKVLLTVHGLSSVIRSFLKIYLGIFFLKLNQWNIGAVALFYAIFYFTNAVFFFILGNQIKCKDKMVTYRIGILSYFIFILLIIILKDNVSNYMYYLAIILGIADGFYWLPYNVLKFELNDYSNRSLFFGYEKAIEDTIKVVIPILIGWIIIVFGSYEPTLIAVLMLTGLAYIFSVKVASPVASLKALDIRKFISLLRKNSEINVFRTYYGEFLRGINYIGALEIVIPILIFLSFSNEFALGALTSIFACISIITALIIGKLLKSKFFRFSIFISGIILFSGSMLLVVNVSKTTIIIYNIVFALTIPILNILQTVFSYNSIDKEKLIDFKVEHLIVREVFRNSGRIFGFLILFIISKLGTNIDMIRMALIILSFSILLISFQAKKFKDS